MIAPILSRFTMLIAAAVLALGCDRGASRRTPLAQSAEALARAPSSAKRATDSPTPSGSTGQSRLSAKSLSGQAAALKAIPIKGRMIAIGDLHGDLESTRRALRVAGAIDEDDEWVGGSLTLVNTGDVLDRGDEEKEIYALLWSLERQAAAKGGRVLLLNGNHELMNVAGDMRYVTKNGFEDFADTDTSVLGAAVARIPSAMSGRIVAFLPGGPWALKIARNPIVALVGRTLYAHGGVTRKHVRFGLEKLNRLAREWMQGGSTAPPEALSHQDSPVWTRRYGDPSPSRQVCKELNEVLAAVGADRLVVGHTVQEKGMRPGCENKLWRIDVGLASYYGSNPIEVLEIHEGRARVLRE